MALIRANIQDRLGDRSIYDCIIECPEDLDTDPMLQHVHTGSIAVCLNLSQDSQDGAAISSIDRYVKSSDGSWKKVAL